MENMTRAQAYQAMQEGLKITHRYFTADEYYYLYNDKIIAEDGVNHTSVFWEQDFKKDGWRLYSLITSGPDMNISMTPDDEIHPSGLTFD